MLDYDITDLTTFFECEPMEDDYSEWIRWNFENNGLLLTFTIYHSITILLILTRVATDQKIIQYEMGRCRSIQFKPIRYEQGDKRERIEICGGEGGATLYLKPFIAILVDQA